MRFRKCGNIRALTVGGDYSICTGVMLDAISKSRVLSGDYRRRMQVRMTGRILRVECEVPNARITRFDLTAASLEEVVRLSLLAR